MLKKEKGHKFTTYGPCSVDDLIKKSATAKTLAVSPAPPGCNSLGNAQYVHLGVSCRIAAQRSSIGTLMAPQGASEIIFGRCTI
jgi:hypothetical protein